MRTKGSRQTAAAEASHSDRISRRSLVRRDEDLLLQYAATGNQGTFEELVRLYERELYAHLRNCLGDAQLAEDAFQNTFLQLHRKCHQFQPGRRLRPWLYTIASNQAIDLLRRNRRHKAVSLSVVGGDTGADQQQQLCGDRLQSEDADPSEQLTMSEDHERAHLAMHRIPAKARQVLMLVVYQGLQYREAAKVLGIPLGTVKSRMHKAVQSLHNALLTTRHSALQENQDTRYCPEFGARSAVLRTRNVEWKHPQQQR
jgi:RNA polymerase sigma-70 factor, ECF subfamily